MKILRLDALHFGKLENFVLEPRAGLNVYRQPNEYGKTTLIYFIYYMFYGYDAKLLKKYLPWSGAEIAGSLTFEKEGRSWRIERRHPAKGMEKRRILCVETGEELALANREQPGPYFLGLDGATFLRTFCITQGDLLFARTDGLDVALKNMAATGDENVSFRQAEDWLNKQHTQYMYRGKNQGPLLTKKENLAAGTVELQQVRQQLSEQIIRHQEWERLEKAIPASDRSIAELQKRLKKAEGSDALRVLRQLEAIRQKKPLEPPAVSQEALAQWQLAYEAAARAKEQASAAAEEHNRLAEQLQLVGENVAQFGFHALSGQEIAKLKKGSGRGTSLAAAVLLVCGALGVAAGALLHFAGYIAGGLCLLAGVLLLGLKELPQKRVCHAYGAANPQQLLEKWEKYQQVLAQQEQLKAARKAAGEAMAAQSAAAEAAAQRWETLRAETRIFSAAELQQMQIRWGVYENSLQENDTALQEQALLNGRSREELEKLAADAELAEETAPQVRQLLGQAEAENRALRDRRDQLDPRLLEELWERQAALKAQNKTLKQEIIEDEQQLFAVQTALGWLQEANREMNTRFAPKLCMLAGEQLARLTGGKYQSLLMDAAYGISLETAEGTYPLDRFSAGTRDGVYFAFRLAVSALLGETALPMVLDDPFVNLDDARRAEAEALLERAAAQRQILYFTCRNA